MTGPKESTPKPRWKTLRCIVEYRTSSNLSERDLARFVQGCLDAAGGTGYKGGFTESKLWAKEFNRSLATMAAARPKKLQATIRALDAVLARMRKL